MRRKLALVFTASFLCLIFALPVFAQAGQEAGARFDRWVVITTGFGMALASAVCGIAQSRAIAAACEGVARNPGAWDSIRFALILGLVLIESLALYTLLIMMYFTFLA